MQSCFFEADFDNLNKFEKYESNQLKQAKKVPKIENKDEIETPKNEKIENKLKIETKKKKEKAKIMIDLKDITPNYKDYMKAKDEFDFKKYISSGEPKNKQDQTDKVKSF